MPVNDDDVNIADDRPFIDYDDHLLLQAWGYFTDAITDRRARLRKVEAEIKLRLDDREGSMIDDPDYTCLMEASVIWDKSVLWHLKELVDPKTLKGNGWTPAYEETVTNKVPESWNMTNIKKLIKLGGEVAQVIKAAKIPGGSRMVIKKKEAAK